MRHRSLLGGREGSLMICGLLLRHALDVIEKKRKQLDQRV
jgi:hypothetical protein